MNDVFVADASITLAWVHPGQERPETVELLSDIAAGASFTVPALWFFEVANALLALERRKRLTAAERREALDRLRTLRPTLDDDGARLVLSTTSDLAATTGLTVYDAAYLEVAKRRRLPLATLDQPLRAVAKKSKVAVLP